MHFDLAELYSSNAKSILFEGLLDKFDGNGFHVGFELCSLLRFFKHSLPVPNSESEFLKDPLTEQPAGRAGYRRKMLLQKF